MEEGNATQSDKTSKPNKTRIRPWTMEGLVLSAIAGFFFCFIIYLATVVSYFQDYADNESRSWFITLFLTLEISLVNGFLVLYIYSLRKPMPERIIQAYGITLWILSVAWSVTTIHFFREKFLGCQTSDGTRCTDSDPEFLTIHYHLAYALAIIFWVIHGMAIMGQCINGCGNLKMCK
jgi:hypothetical protein